MWFHKYTVYCLVLIGIQIAHPIFSSGQEIEATQPCRARTLDLRAQPLSVADSATCAELVAKLWELHNQHVWPVVYDSGKYLVEHCYDNIDDVELALTFLQGAVQGLWLEDTDIYNKYRSWLESVMFLNTTDPAYFCSCLLSIATTYHSASDTSETQYWREGNKTLAIDKWCLDNHQCDSDGVFQHYNQTRASQREDWLNDTSVLWDTTLPSMKDLGLDSLLKLHLIYASVDENTPNAPAILSNVSASPDPVSTGTVISFTMNKEAYVRITLYDVLGKQLGASTFESLFQPGNKSVSISLAGLPSGTYYARIQTAYGEVQTVKLVKQ